MFYSADVQSKSSAHCAEFRANEVMKWLNQRLTYYCGKKWYDSPGNKWIAETEIRFENKLFPNKTLSQMVVDDVQALFIVKSLVFCAIVSRNVI